mmetsp:Transcript_27122/g.38159  ORF Transcript_27122/g.38159 Transcript_27122/m.38159 type:complete len:375 (-) Transcript_27122:253-1377(-)
MGLLTRRENIENSKEHTDAADTGIRKAMAERQESNASSNSTPSSKKPTVRKIAPTIVSVVRDDKDERIGLALGNKNDGTIVIGSIADGSLFEGTELKTGMELLSMNVIQLEGDSLDSIKCKGKSTKEIADFLRLAVGRITVEAVNAGGLEIIKGMTPHVMDLAEKVPVSGKLVKLLDEFAKETKETKAHREGFRNVALWSKNIKAGLFHCAPLLLQVKDVEDNIGPLMERLLECLQELMTMTKCFVNRHYILELITTADFKRRYDDAKTVATALLMAVQLTIEAVRVRYANKPGAKQDYVARVMQENINSIKRASLIVIEVDEPLDILIADQHKSLRMLQDDFMENSKMEVEMDVLLELVARTEPARYVKVDDN